MHPGGRRCSSLSYTRYARSLRLARRAPRHPEMAHLFPDGPLASSIGCSYTVGAFCLEPFAPRPSPEPPLLAADRAVALIERPREPGLAPREPQRRRRIVVVEPDVDAHVAVAAPPGEEVDAGVRAAALQVVAEIHPAALAGLDDPIAQERHVVDPLAGGHATGQPPG